MLTLAIILLISVTAATQVKAQGCSLNASITFFLVANQDFKIPDDSDSFKFDYSEEFYIGCPRGTTSHLLSDDGEKVTCIDGTLVKMATTGDILDLTDIKCNARPPSYARKLDSVCEEKGTLVEVGFDLYQNFVPAYSVCFDEINLVTLTVFCNATSSDLGKLSRQTTFTENSFMDTGHLYGDVDIDGIYLHQKNTFDDLGLSQYLNDSIRLVPGQLLPNYLFAYPLKANAFYDYANAIPTWNIQESASIQRLMETLIPQAPPFYYAGTSGVVTLPNDAGVEVELYLHLDKVPVPEWLWLEFFNGRDQTSLWLYNNPFSDESEVRKKFVEMYPNPHYFGQWENILVGISIK